MADEKKGMGPEEPIVPESSDGRPVSELAAEQGVIPGMGDSPAPPGPGDVVVDFEKINELMAEKRSSLNRERRSPARAARPRLTRRSMTGPRRRNETKCPEAKRLTR